MYEDNSYCPEWKDISSTGYAAFSITTTDQSSELRDIARSRYKHLQYRCVISNPYGSVTTDAVRGYTIGWPPLHPYTMYPDVNAGEKAAFFVRVNAADEGWEAENPMDIQYQWQYSATDDYYYDDEHNTVVRYHWHNSTSPSAKTATLNIAGTYENAALVYRCVISNPSGSVVTQNVRVVIEKRKK